MAEACSVPGCSRERKARGWCLPHYKRWKRRGSVHDITPEETFFARVSEAPGGCWLWDRAMDSGYGQFSDGGRMSPAHRWSYEFLRAEVPAGLVLDHLCRTPLCVNPWHLEPVTQRVNLVRSSNFMAQRIDATHCQRGHPFDAANTYLRKDRPGRRQCRTCAATRDSSRTNRRPVGASQGG